VNCNGSLSINLGSYCILLIFNPSNGKYAWHSFGPLLSEIHRYQVYKFLSSVLWTGFCSLLNDISIAWPLTCGRSVYIMGLTATFLNYVHNIKFTQKFVRLGVLLIVIFLCATHSLSQNNGCSPFLQKVWRSMTLSFDWILIHCFRLPSCLYRMLIAGWSFEWLE
jgi:hypothetical protein